MSGGSGGAGGFVLPTVLTADLVDLARNKSRVLEAGARVVPMANRTVDVPRWIDDPTPEWRAENAPIAEDDGAIDKLTLSAHTLAVVTKVSRELIEDTSLEEDLKAAFAAAFALKIDLGALYGTGANDQPLGVKNTPGVTKTPMATNGAVPTWDALIDAVGRLRDVNEEPNAQIMSDRTARTLAKQKDSDQNYIGAPAYLDGVTRHSTNQVPNNLTVGTSGTTTSDVFTADWSQLYLGVRMELQISLLTERYMVDAGQYAFVAWWRGDVQVARPKAFDVLTGVKAS
jgi:HK97 family phage major capsid protein